MSRDKPADGTDPELSFHIREGDDDNYFLRDGPAAAHLLIRPASEAHQPARLIVAFPAGNEGLALWFDSDVARDGAADETSGGRVALAPTLAAPPSAVVEPPADGVSARTVHGVAATVRFDACCVKLSRSVLGSVRTLREALDRDPPEVVLAGTTVDGDGVRRTLLDGRRLSLRVEPLDGATAALDVDGRLVLRAGSASPDAITARLSATTEAEPLAPIPADRVLAASRSRGELDEHDRRDLQALAFLSYGEKLCAGSWRFLTYFGRDTLLSVRLMIDGLHPDVIEAALGSVLSRLGPIGEVAHEEAIGDFAALERGAEAAGDGGRSAGDDNPPSSEPIYDYKMVDDDFLLAPIVAHYLLETEAGRARAGAFLRRSASAGGATHADLLRRNLHHVLELARSFAASPGASTLIALCPGEVVGQWRDSHDGLGGGRIPFDVNAVLVPAALRAARRLWSSELLADRSAAAEAEELARAWSAAKDYFDVRLSLDEAERAVRRHAAELGIDPQPAIEALGRDGKGALCFSALALDGDGTPLPVMHSDEAAVLLFGEPSGEQAAQLAERLLRPFPAGLHTAVGLLVANPAYCTAPAMRRRFSPAHYHGAVVWSWQQAQLACGLRRQLARDDLSPAARQSLARAETATWQTIEAESAMRTSELWSWRVDERGRYAVEPFGQGSDHDDESNAAQLWSTVYLSVRPPAERG